jgi:hypothetical protein
MFYILRVVCNLVWIDGMKINEMKKIGGAKVRHLAKLPVSRVGVALQPMLAVLSMNFANWSTF